MSRPLGRALPSLTLLALFFVLTTASGALPPSGAQRRRPAPPPRRTPDARQAADRAQAAGIRRLRAASAVRPTLKLERGAVRFAELDVRVPASAGTSADARASWFLGEHRDLLRVKNPAADFQLTRRSPNGDFVFFRRRHLGIPVFPGGIGVHLAGGRVRALTGSYVADEIEASPVPRLTAAQAERAARDYDRRSRQVLGDTSLRYVNTGLLDAGDHVTRLAWRVNLDTHKTVYVDANTGRRLYTSAREVTDFDLELENRAGREHRGGWPCRGGPERWFEEDGPVPGANPDQEGWDAFNNIKAVDKFFRDHFGRDGYDGDGDDVEMYIHVKPFAGTAHYLKDCDIFEFSEGSPVNDVVGHEFTHGVNWNANELEYANQSGALDESLADIFGHFVDPGDWTIAEDLPGPPFRDMQDPTRRNDPDRFLSPNKWPHASDPDEGNDWGGVHHNSGIHNKAAYLIIQGDTFRSRTIRGLGRAKARQLFYAVLMNLWDSARFIDARDFAVWKAQYWGAFGTHGFTPNDACQVQNAYAAVDLGEGDADCDGTGDHSDAITDTDDDAASDGNDNCPGISNPGQWDWDGDGLGNECDPDDDGDGRNDGADNCPGIPNPGQQNSDGDGFGDACDDSDFDGLKDAVDNCPTVDNVDQKDTDGDGRGDACDNDIDGDNVPNGSDNCPLDSNSDQKETDGDPIGDACDLCHGVRSSDNGDPDGDGRGNPCDTDDDNDGHLDAADNCPLDDNPSQSDIDGDGVGFACDEDERKLVFDSLKENNVLMARAPLHIPVPVCPPCGGMIPNGHEEVIIVEAPAGFDVSILDSEGATVTNGVRGATRHVLRFQPPPHGSSALRPPAFGAGSFAGGAAARRSLPLDKPAPDELRYYLVVTPPERVDVRRGYRVSFRLDRGPRARPGPVVRPTPVRPR